MTVNFNKTNGNYFRIINFNSLYFLKNLKANNNPIIIFIFFIYCLFQ